MKGFINVCRADTCASGVIPECCSRESVVTKRRDSVTLRAAKPYGMTAAWGARTVNASIVSFQGKGAARRVPESRNKMRSFSNKQTGSRIHVRDDNDNRSRIKTLRDDGLTTRGRTANAGFTLIELLVVVLIIGILAAVAVPQYQKAVTKARFATIRTVVENLYRAEEVFYLANGYYQANTDLLDFDYKGRCTGTDVLTCDKWFVVDILGGAGVVTNPDSLFINAYYCPKAQAAANCGDNAEFVYTHYLAHSSKPGQMTCVGYTTEGKAFCKSFQ